MKPAVVLQKDGRWIKLDPEEFETEYHETLIDSDTVWWFDEENMTIGSAELKAAMWLPGQGLCYIIGYYPNIIINGVPKIDAVPAGVCRATREEVDKDIETYKSGHYGKTAISWVQR